MIQTIMILAVISAGFYFLTKQLNNQKKVVLETDSVISTRFALHSLLDYMLFGLRHKYCFNNNLLQDVCTLTHPASSERIMMSQSQADLLRMQLIGDPVTAPLADSLRLKTFTIYTPLSRIGSIHPLYPVVERLGRKLKNAQFKVKVTLEEGAAIPRAGQEVYLLVTAGLVDAERNDLVMESGAGRKTQTKLSLSSYLTAYPRELGTFALVVAKDLYLDRPYDRPVGAGSSSIHSFVKANGDAFPDDGVGLTFLSPVFVNEDIYLPRPKDHVVQNRALAGEVYTPVTFAGRVYLGNGEVKEGISKYTPFTAGGDADRYWADNRLFGGFRAGVNVDGAVDKGLQVLAGLAPSLPANASLMQKCILRNMVKSDVAIMKKSSLYGNIENSGPNRASYFLGLNEGNSFAPQFNFVTPVDASGWSGSFKRTPEKAGPILKVTGEFGSLRIEAQVLEDSVFSLKPEPGSEAYRKKLEAKLDAAKALVPSDSVAVADAQAIYDEFLEMRTTKRPELTLKVKPVSIGGSGPQPHLVELEIEAKNPGSFLDDKGIHYLPKFRLTGFDGTYAQGRPLGPPNNKLTVKLSLGGGPTGFTFPSVMSDAYDNPRNIDTDLTDYFNVDKNCEDLRGTVDSQAFGGASWNTDFSGQTRERSWNFAGNSPADTPQDPLVSVLSLGGSWTQSPASFKVRSIVGTCRIPGDVTFVTGFYVCDRLVIEPRIVNNPLRIIGTFIVSNLKIHPSALVRGIRWSGIYHPQSMLDLRKAGVLASKKVPAGDCDKLPVDARGKAIPTWHPTPSIKDVQDRFSCNAISLREKAANFRWTQVDPDCGIQPGGSSTTCKNRQTQFLLFEHSRGGGL